MTRTFVEVDQSQLRARIEDAVEVLLALLDEIDGCPDDESSLGAPERSPHQLSLVGGVTRDGSASQIDWAAGIDAEDEEIER